MSTHFSLDFTSYLKAILHDMFAPYVLEWDNIHFENSLAALRPFNTCSVMKIINILLNGWATRSRIKGAHSVYPCLAGCHGGRDDLCHYIFRAMCFSQCKVLNRELSIHPH